MKLKINGARFYSNPAGDLQSTKDSGTANLQKDIGLDTYSTFTAKADWKFTRKNHLYFVASPFTRSHQTVVTRTIMFQGQTFVAGLTVQSEFKSNLYALGYQYPILRRKRGHLGISAQCDLFDSHAAIHAMAQVTSDGVKHAAVSASHSLLAPIPVLGPEFPLYLTNSPRVYVQGNAYGMYFFGYGTLCLRSASLAFG